jgi:hypothetical protein
VRLKLQAVGLNRAELMFMRDQYVEHPSCLVALAMKRLGWWKRLVPTWTRAGSASGCRQFPRSR